MAASVVSVSISEFAFVRHISSSGGMAGGGSKGDGGGSGACIGGRGTGAGTGGVAGDALDEPLQSMRITLEDAELLDSGVTMFV